MSTPFAAEVAAARTAQESWGRLPVRERLRCVRKLRALLVERMDAVGEAIAADIGRPALEIAGSEILPTAAALKFLEKRAARALAPRAVSWWDQPTWLMGNRDVVHHRPWGVVGIIGTWNYPVFLNVGQIAQALVAGNAVLWKPSENVPQTSVATAQLFRDAGLPPALLQVLPATREAGPQLAEADVDHVVFTGSDVVGRKLAARLGERLVPSTLELSGCDAMFVFADADLAMAAKAAWFGLSINRGQTCIAVRRVFVQRQWCEAFVALLKPLIERAGPMGLVTPGQLTQAERLIRDAVKRGATAVPAPNGEGNDGPVGGGAASASLRPTVLINVPADAAFCREACFAPVTAVIPFDTPDEALALAKLSPFGLSASVFSADVEAGRAFAARVPSGSVVINDVLAPTAHPATPFGGRGASGWGETQGREGLLAMTTPQVVTVHNGTLRPHLDDAANPDPATGEILRGLIRFSHGRGLRHKLGGLWQMVRGVRRKKK
ncbi:Putative succinate-semialdehyde dehydrogenase [NADP(+)] 2 [Gemmata obscuriglobus]|uniref:Aldehyde dehydrogenase n=1 Tax=Gemmata obscuriglobus TaxID=114 RepID=A0A2Z3H337_9BACT|nr:aldehyde dehydrogenase family protein [Gemmata obscuriglobus]AWM36024.1 aldehyde dehydrogenase [Gemmata obscuriglobus]QEG31403.1 Putative succinate-semialdehyde dehydrogenase [NADP(+)] 2 [Gemmata obscuriglobus]VTS10743.1 aldehyde dehydrogenase : Aldehyde dehydrogenase OS=Bacillus macauensis ZFHKF-1 GN=A374_13800 PE=3 SV=1: Aldedh [Gemmata obscuriglobus UQM 2246]